MTDSDIKLEIFRTVDQLTGKELEQVYRLLLEFASTTEDEEMKQEDSVNELEAAYEEMAEDERKGIRSFDKEEEWTKELSVFEENKEEYGGYLSTLSKEEYSELESDYEEMAEDERTGKRNLDW